MYDYKKYLAHSFGISNLINWLGRWHKFNQSYHIDSTFIELGSLVSGRFGIGVPKNKSFGKHLFIAVQPEELLWVELIQWDRCVIKENEDKLYLVAKRLNGDEETMPDVPAFAISLLFDSSDKVELLKTQKNIDFRQLWYEDDNNTQHISRNLPLLSLPLSLISKEQPILSEIEIHTSNSFDDLLLRKIEKTNSYNSSFQGGSSTIMDPALKSLLETFDPNSVQKVTDEIKIKKEDNK